MPEPLIWTTKGNLPLAQLRHETEWRVSEDCIVFVERYFLGEEMVKESSHVKVLHGVSADGTASI